MTWYKAFDKDLKCRGMQYEIGEEYKIDEEPILCKKGFHFCKTIRDCYMFYPLKEETRICEVEPLGKVVSDKTNNVKFCTNHIKILKEIDPKSFYVSDNTSTGLFNSNKYNCGNFNSGCSNVGNYNAGECNTGSYNSGDNNVGDCNTGKCNVGDGNIGDDNTGAYNTGYGNSGSYNNGNFNSGRCNNGRYNSGEWNSGNHNSGIFNTDKEPKIRIFDKESDWTFKDWSKSRAYSVMRTYPHSITRFIYEQSMSEEEKAEHPEYITTGGYLKETIVTKEHKQKWWDELPNKDKLAIYSIPNFDADKFTKCTGIVPTMDLNFEGVSVKVNQLSIVDVETDSQLKDVKNTIWG